MVEEGAETGDAAIAALSALSSPAGDLARRAGDLLVLAIDDGRVLAFVGPTGERMAARSRDRAAAARYRALAPDATAAPRLERLRIEASPFAPPAVCACLRVVLPGVGAVLLVAPLAALRPAEPPAASAPRADETAQTPPAAAPVERRPDVRFVWRSDAEGRVVSASSSLVDRVRGGVVGRTWDELLAETLVDPDGRLAAALVAAETFRAVRVRWRVAGLDRDVAVDLSASPLRAPDGNFAGFGGFGLIEGEAVSLEPQAVEAATEAATATIVLAPPAPTPAPASAPDPTAGTSPPAQRPEPRRAPAGPPDFATLAGAAMAGFAELLAAPLVGLSRRPESAPAARPVAGSTAPAARAEEPVRADPPVPSTQAAAAVASLDPEPAVAEIAVAAAQPVDAAEAEPVAEEPASASDPDEGEAPQGAPSTPDTQLSLSEHHAFREIARALGARFAGDEAAPRDEAAPTGELGGAVTPFRAPGARPSVETEPAAGEAADVRRLVDRLPIGVLVHRGDGALYANRAFLETVDYPDLAALQGDGGVGRLFRGDAGARRGGEGATVTLSTRSGASVPVELRLTTIEWGGFPAGLMQMRRLPDVDPAQRAAALELDLAARNARLAELGAILAAGGAGVATFDAESRLTGLDRAAEALFGYDQREVAGEPLSFLAQAEDRPALEALVEAARAGGVAEGEFTARCRRGGPLPLPLAVRVARLPAEASSAFCAVLRDASPARAEAEALLAARRAAEGADARRAAFVNRIGHEVRAPLNAILGFAEVMLEERFGSIGGERHRGYLRDIRAAGAHVVALVDGLLELARIEADRDTLAFTTVDLNEAASESVAAHQPQAARARVIVRTSFATGLPPILADAGSLREIAGNVIANAIEFTGAGGQVIVSTALTERGEVALRVRDTGAGMTRAEIAAALDPFRGDAPDLAARHPGRRGLGLPLARALAAANRCALSLTSTQGEGTLVELLAPPARVLADRAAE